MPLPGRGRCGDSGAAALEFALVVPVLIALVMGIVDYGLFFTDRLAVSQGIRDGARAAAVSDQPACGNDPNLYCLADRIRDGIGAVGGRTDVRVRVIHETDPSRWNQGDTLEVCAVVAETGLTGLTPVPDRIYDSIRVRLEHNVPTSTVVEGQADVVPGGWAWCTTP